MPHSLGQGRAAAWTMTPATKGGLHPGTLRASQSSPFCSEPAFHLLGYSVHPAPPWSSLNPCVSLALLWGASPPLRAPRARLRSPSSPWKYLLHRYIHTAFSCFAKAQRSPEMRVPGGWERRPS